VQEESGAARVFHGRKNEGLLADRWRHRVSILRLTLVPVRIRDSRFAGVIQFRHLLRRQPPPLRSDVLHQLFFIARPND
jgi:hypothetical protein